MGFGKESHLLNPEPMSNHHINSVENNSSIGM
jgi:hypothetical protein